MRSRSAMVLIVFVSLVGCTKYPQVEFENLEFVAALRTACSARNPQWLERTVAAIESAHQEGRMQNAEYEAYQPIIALAQAGEWKQAEMECFRFQQDQLAR